MLARSPSIIRPSRRGLLRAFGGAGAAALLSQPQRLLAETQMPIIPRQGQAKPWGSIPRINKAHPLAQGLVYYAYDVGGVVIDLVSGQQGTIQSATNPLINETYPYGSGIYYPASFGSAIIMPLNRAVITLTATAPWAVGFAFYPTVTPTSNNDTMLAIEDSSSNQSFFVANTPFGGTNLLIRITDAAAGGGENPVTANGSYVALQFNSSLTNVLPNGTSGNIWSNGVFDQSYSGTTTTYTSSATTQFMINNYFPGGAEGGGGILGFLPYCGMWKRVFSAEDAFRLHTDPYCFLIYPEDEMFSTLVGAGAAPPSGTPFRNLMGVGL